MNSLDSDPVLPFGLDAVVESLVDAVIVHDLDDRLLYCNAAAEQIYGWSRDAILGLSMTKVLYLDPEAREKALQALREDGRWTGLLSQVDQAGELRQFRVWQTLQRDRNGCPQAIISQNCEAHASNEQAHAVQSSNLLAGGVAHEMNNALAPILLSSAMLKQYVATEKAYELVTVIEKSARRGSDLIHELLAFERGRGGGHETICKTKILRAIQRAKCAALPDKVGLDTRLDADLDEFLGNRESLVRLFEPIMRNAAEAMRGGGELLIRGENIVCDERFLLRVPASRAGPYVGISFCDEGCGIEPSLIKRVAEPFVTTKQPKQTRGHGLTQAQSIIRGHGGFMTLASDRGRGCTVTVYFPAKIPGPTADGGHPSEVVKPAVAARGRCILVADDEPFVREMLHDLLEEWGFQVRLVADGEQALQCCLDPESAIDLVIADVAMPAKDGIALYRELRECRPTQKTLLSSGYGTEEQLAEIANCGAEHFLPKPFTANQLARSLEKLFG